MFFEDEKDFIGNPADIHIDEEGNVSWESVLDDSEDLVSLKSDSMVSGGAAKTASKFDDELELVNISNMDEDDNDKLNEILSHDLQSSSSYETISNSDIESSELEEVSFDEEFDIDSQLASVASEQNKSDNIDIKPRKNETPKKSSGMMPILIALLVAIMAGGGYYYIREYTGSQNLNNEALELPQTKVDEMNNLDKEDIVQRQAENIPVVNEENAAQVTVDEAKAQEEEAKKAEEEKKQVISVKPAGRINPFMPTAKYATSDIPDVKVDYDSAGIPKPPEEFGIKEETVKLMSIMVSGIMYDEVKPSAIISFEGNDYFVQEGDKLDDFKIVDIARNHVSISLDNNIYRANIGEEFKIDVINGSADYVGGARHYKTQNQEKPRQSADSRRYVSEEDIVIRAK